MKINNKYQYFEKTKKPILKDFENKKDFLTAKTLFEIEMKTGGLIWANDFENKVKLKTTKTRISRIEIKIGSTIYIERWDGNGIPSKTKVVNIKAGKTRAIINTNKGFFIFSVWNAKKDNIIFKWTCKGKEWHKKYMKWVDGDKYFLNIPQ